MEAWHSQDRHLVRLEWGPEGGALLAGHARAAGSDVLAVVVDVLSFTTCVSVAADRDIRVRPYRWKDASAETYAREHNAVLARSRADASSGGVSLSPGTIRAAAGATDLVLPSPNGSTISAALAEAGAEVVAGCMRNRTAVARWLADRLAGSRGRPPVILFVPAGERWLDGSLRPSAEDLWGAGAVADALVRRLEHQAGPLLLSPEAQVGFAAWHAVAGRVEEALYACASGRELAETGWPDDVAIAAELDASGAVPLLRDGVFASA